MNTLDAQCFLASVMTAEDERVLPLWWHHDVDGTLSFRFSDSTNTWSYPPEQVPEIAERWQTEASGPPTPRIARHVEATRRFVAIVDHGGIRPPDAIVHDLIGDEIAAFWRDEKLAVIVELSDPEGFDRSRLPRAA